MELRRPRCPNMNRDAVLIREPQERLRVIGDRVMDRAVLLGNLNTLEPFWKSLDNVLLKESFSSNSAMVTLHGDWTSPQMRQHYRRDHLVILRKFAFGNAVGGKQDFVRVGNDHLHNPC